MNQDAKAALNEMKLGALYLGTVLLQLATTGLLCVAAIAMMLLTVWMFIKFFWIAASIAFCALMVLWFRMEYTSAKATREYDELCRVNKGELNDKT